MLMYGADRTTVLQWLCNMMATCCQMAGSVKRNSVSPITEERLARLYPNFSKE
jgi:hypothetical protein